MFDGEMAKRNFPFEKKFGQKFLVQDKVGLRTFLVQDNVGLRTFLVQDKVGLRKLLVQDKLGLRKFSPKFYFAKSLKMSCLMGKWCKRNSI